MPRPHWQELHTADPNLIPALFAVQVFIGFMTRYCMVCCGRGANNTLRHDNAMRKEEC